LRCVAEGLVWGARYAGAPSTTLRVAASVRPTSRNPAAANSSANSSRVRSRPPGPTSMLRSENLVFQPSFGGGTTRSRTRTDAPEVRGPQHGGPPAARVAGHGPVEDGPFVRVALPVLPAAHAEHALVGALTRAHALRQIGPDREVVGAPDERRPLAKRLRRVR